MANLKTNFMTIDRAVVISLVRDRMRLDRFYQNLPEEWPFPRPEHFIAIDGAKVPEPPWWKAGAAAWGCFRSHQMVIENALNCDTQSILVLEDDAVCASDFRAQFDRFARELPNDWEWVYLGGQHIQREKGLPIKITEHVYRPFNTHRSHAYVLRGSRVMRSICEHLNTPERWGEKNHVDHRFGELQADFPGGLYCPDQWLIGQAAGYSNIKKKHLEANFFPDARWHYEVKISCPVVAVVGNNSYLRKLVAAILHRIGVPFGEARPADDIDLTIDSYAAPGLESVCNSLVTNPFWNLANDAAFRVAHLKIWADQRQRKIASCDSPIGATHSKLALLLNEMSLAWTSPKIIVVDSPLNAEPTGLGLIRKQKIDKCLAELNEQLFKGVLRLDGDALTKPQELVDHIIAFVGANPPISVIATAKQIAAAANRRIN